MINNESHIVFYKTSCDTCIHKNVCKTTLRYKDCVERMKSVWDSIDSRDDFDYSGVTCLHYNTDKKIPNTQRSENM